MSRVDYGEGTVFQRNDAKALWVASFVENGKQKRITATTRKAVIAKRKQALQRISEGLTGSEARQTFATIAKHWKDVTSHSLKLSEASRRVYVDVLNLHVEPVIGALKIQAVTPSHVETVMARMRDKGLSPAYRQQAHKAMSHVFKLAIRDGIIKANPTREVPAPQGTVKTKVVPDRDLIKVMIASAADERLRTFLVLSAHTGLRIAEVLELRWSDVSPTTKSISIRNGKGGKSRVVYLTPSLGVQLAKWKVEQVKLRLAASWWSKEDWIITSDVGTQSDTHNFRRKHFNPLRDLVAPGVTPHSLRHAFATLMLEEGVPMRVVADQMGHSSTRITEDIYSHVTRPLIDEAGAAVERALGGN